MKVDYKNVCVIVPAYNESESLPNILKEIKSVSKKLTICVVDDGSNDQTFEVVQKLKSVYSIKLPFNLGIGSAVQTGLVWARNKGFKVAAQIDGDGQHNPQYLPKLLDNLVKDVDLVIGSRYATKTGYKTPVMRRIGIKIFSRLIELTCGKKIFDSTSGYRVFGKNSLNFFADNYPQEFPEPRSIVQALKKGLKIKEIPVEMRPRITGKSSVTWFKSIYLMFSISIAILIESLSFKNKDG